MTGDVYKDADELAAKLVRATEITAFIGELLRTEGPAGIKFHSRPPECDEFTELAEELRRYPNRYVSRIGGYMKQITKELRKLDDLANKRLLTDRKVRRQCEKLSGLFIAFGKAALEFRDQLEKGA